MSLVPFLMKRILSFLFLLGMGWVTLYAQNAALKFNQAGEFKRFGGETDRSCIHAEYTDC